MCNKSLEIILLAKFKFEISDCQANGKVPLGYTFNGTKTYAGESASVSCDVKNGYHGTPNNSLIKCLNDGNWSLAFDGCQLYGKLLLCFMLKNASYMFNGLDGQLQ